MLYEVITLYQLFQLEDNGMTMFIEGHDISQMGRKLVVDRNFTPSGFIEYFNFEAISKSAGSFYGTPVNIVDDHMIFNLVVGQIVFYVVDVYVGANRAIVYVCMVDAAFFFNTAK